jgi:hypothetical protein
VVDKIQENPFFMLSNQLKSISMCLFINQSMTTIKTNQLLKLQPDVVEKGRLSQLLNQQQQFWRKKVQKSQQQQKVELIIEQRSSLPKRNAAIIAAVEVAEDCFNFDDDDDDEDLDDIEIMPIPKK